MQLTIHLSHSETPFRQSCMSARHTNFKKNIISENVWSTSRVLEIFHCDVGTDKSGFYVAVDVYFRMESCSVGLEGLEVKIKFSVHLNNNYLRWLWTQTKMILMDVKIHEVLNIISLKGLLHKKSLLRTSQKRAKWQFFGSTSQIFRLELRSNFQAIFHY